MRFFFMFAVAACAVLSGCISDERHAADEKRGVIQIDCDWLKRAVDGYSPPPSGYMHAVSIVAMKAIMADEVQVEVENHLYREELEVYLKLMIDMRDFDLRLLTIPPEGTKAVTFSLPVSILDGHIFSAVIEPRKPEKLTPWEKEMDFGQRSVVYDPGAKEYGKVGRVSISPEAEGCPSRWEEKPGIFIETETGGGISAKIHTGWDGEYFFLAADVEDEKHFNTRTEGSIWDGDSLQFSFAPIGADPFNIILAFASGRVRAHKSRGPDTGLLEKSSYTAVRDDEAGRTFYEFIMPLELLKIEPEKGVIFGFNAVVFDDDDGSGYDYWIQITPGIAGGWDPGFFRRFVLVE